jgi:hypothetical protein
VVPVLDVHATIVPSFVAATTGETAPSLDHGAHQRRSGGGIDRRARHRNAVRFLIGAGRSRRLTLCVAGLQR